MRRPETGDVRSVHIGARVPRTPAREPLASSTVKDLVVGSGSTFGDRGLYQIRRGADRWRLYAMMGDGAAPPVASR
jgi:hypothetical protein